MTTVADKTEETKSLLIESLEKGIGNKTISEEWGYFSENIEICNNTDSLVSIIIEMQKNFSKDEFNTLLSTAGNQALIKTE